MSIYFSLACSRASGDAALSRFSCGDPKLCLPDFLKMLLLALPQIYTREFHLWRSIDLDRASVRDSRPCKFFSLVCSPAFIGAVFVLESRTIVTGLFKDASYGPPPNLHSCISHVEVCRFGQCLGGRFSPMSICFPPVILHV